MGARARGRRHALTGSYNNAFHIYDVQGKNDIALEASKNAFKKKPATSKPKLGLGRKKKEEVPVEAIDFNKKILHAAWHPHENSIAVAATNNLFVFSQL